MHSNKMHCQLKRSISARTSYTITSVTTLTEQTPHHLMVYYVRTRE